MDFVAKVKGFNIEWDLSTAKGCRDFLKNIRIGKNGPIQALMRADGETVTIDDASDEQVIQTAREIAEAYCNRSVIQ